MTRFMSVALLTASGVGSNWVAAALPSWPEATNARLVPPTAAA